MSVIDMYINDIELFVYLFTLFTLTYLLTYAISCFEPYFWAEVLDRRPTIRSDVADKGRRHAKVASIVGEIFLSWTNTFGVGDIAFICESEQAVIGLKILINMCLTSSG